MAITRYLVGYCPGGSPSRPNLLRTIRAHGDAIVRELEIGKDDVMTFGTEPRPWAKTSGWTITYTGRTQRDAQRKPLTWIDR